MITTTVELTSSRLVGHDTFFNSSFTSLINFAALFIYFAVAGAAGLEPAVTALETVGLPVNRRS